MRKALLRFQWAVLVRNAVVPVESYADLERSGVEGAKINRKNFEMIGQIENMAFADG